MSKILPHLYDAHDNFKSYHDARTGTSRIKTLIALSPGESTDVTFRRCFSRTMSYFFSLERQLFKELLVQEA